jgi:hypothetical protein
VKRVAAKVAVDANLDSGVGVGQLEYSVPLLVAEDEIWKPRSPVETSNLASACV